MVSCFIDVILQINYIIRWSETDFKSFLEWAVFSDTIFQPPVKKAFPNLLKGKTVKN